MTKYDDIDYHVEAASDAGYEENAFAHIGLYLGWLVRNELHNPVMFTEEQVVGVKSGAFSGSDLADNGDGKLLSELMTADGDRFSAWYYVNRYPSDFGETFAGFDDYAVADDEVSRATIEAVLDRRFEEWTSSGRPEPESSVSSPTTPDLSSVSITIGGLGFMEAFDAERKAVIEEMLADAREQGWQIAGPPPLPHTAPELEALIPLDLAPELELSSRTARQWRSSGVNRVVKAVGVPADKAMVVVGMGGRGDGNVTATIYGFPRVPADVLAEHVSALTKQPGMTCEARLVAGRTVLWCSWAEFLVAGWARDGMIVDASAQDPVTLEQLISRLP